MHFVELWSSCVEAQSLERCNFYSRSLLPKKKAESMSSIVTLEQQPIFTHCYRHLLSIRAQLNSSVSRLQKVGHLGRMLVDGDFPLWFTFRNLAEPDSLFCRYKPGILAGHLMVSSFESSDCIHSFCGCLWKSIIFALCKKLGLCNVVLLRSPLQPLYCFSV